ncbi:hypothetical protein [Helicobacter kayseriensis]|uniref:hypothetical protein n=1 Tax=Helicobacter kayseriensis TaxID=2905877 RepID=UPI001E5056EC|nr:hypothetical protein [Helicobacter kayseriensis]MCE3046976.1 hypothetical protein [Helicobacter kayseriensis]
MLVFLCGYRIDVFGLRWIVVWICSGIRQCSSGGGGHFEQALNPYSASLSGDNFMANIPNYMPLLYIVMYPIGLLEWEDAKIVFAFLNYFFFLATVFLFLTKSGVERGIVFVFSTLVILGFTYGNVVSNAQTTIFMGFCAVIAYCYRKNSTILTIALTFLLIKHSVGVPIVFGFFLAGFRKESILSGILMLLIISVTALVFGVTPVEFLQSMLQVNSQTYTSQGSLGGPGDLISLSQKLFHTPYSPIGLLSLCLYLFFALIVYLKKPHTSQIIATSIVLSLVSLPHLGYDYYLLFIALVLAFKNMRVTYLHLYVVCFTLFLWRCSFLKPWIDAINLTLFPNWGKTHWAMDMGIPFCVFVVMNLFLMGYVFLNAKSSASKQPF